jgi:dynamin 1-like protein
MQAMPRTQMASNYDPGMSEDRNNREVFIIKELIKSYFNTVRTTINDMVPKTVMAFLVNKTMHTAQNSLVQRIYNDGNALAELLDDHVETRNKKE